MTSSAMIASYYGLRMDDPESFAQGYADGMRLDARGQGKPCGRGFISARKKCSAKGAQQLAADLKAGDEGARARVAIGKRNAQNRQALKRSVQAAQTERRENPKPPKKVPMKDLKAGVMEAFGAKNWSELKANPNFRMGVLSGRGEGNPFNPRSEKDWRQAYRDFAGVPKDERNEKGSTVINGVDFMKNFRPWHAFELDPKTATVDDIKKAYRRLAKKHHPDVGGDPEVFARIGKMRESLMFGREETPKKRKRG